MKLNIQPFAAWNPGYLNSSQLFCFDSIRSRLLHRTATCIDWAKWMDPDKHFLPSKKRYIAPDTLENLMKSIYDDYYQSEDLFGDPYPELIEFFAQYPKRGKLLDLGCGQGRDAIPLARMGYAVTGIDCAEVGINQMLATARQESLNLTGMVGDMYAFDRFQDFEVILLNSLFHFNKKDRETETTLIKRIFQSARPQTIVVFCIQDQLKKVAILEEIIEAFGAFKQLMRMNIEYTFTDKESDHTSTTPYLLLTIQVG